MEMDKSAEFPAWAHYLFGCLYAIAVIMAIAINGMTVYVFIKKKQLRSSTNVFVMCLCLTDLLMAGMGGPLVIISSFQRHWMFHDGGCSYYSFIVCLMSYTNIGLVLAISVDRYVVIVRNSKVTLYVAWWLVVGCVVHSFVWSVAPILGWSSYTLEGMYTSCSINWQSKEPGDVSLSLALLIELWFIPLIIMMFCYVKIFNKLRSHTNTVQKLNTNQTRNTEKELAKTLFFIIAAFVLAWTPYSIVSAWAAIGDHRDIHPVLETLPHLCVKFSMVYNPIIYLNRNRQFQKAFLSEFPAFSKIKCFRTKIMPVSTNPQNFELRTSGRLQPREPTISGEKNFCVFDQHTRFSSSGRVSTSGSVTLFKKSPLPLKIPNVEDNDADHPKPSTSKEYQRPSRVLQSISE